MYKVEVALNEGKIRAEGKYSLDKIYAAIDKSFVNDALMPHCLIEADGARIYTTPTLKNKDHYAMIQNEIANYMDEKWFTDNVLKFLYGDNGDGDSSADLFMEDVLEEWDVGKSVA